MRTTATLLTIGVLLAALLAGVGFLQTAAPVAAHEDGKLGARVFEMRTYYTHEGKLDHLHKRFRVHTNHLFVKHGMSLVGYWTPVDAKDTLVYILGYESREARETSWAAFKDDAEWKRVFKASHEAAGGPIVKTVESRFLEPTDYSPIR